MYAEYQAPVFVIALQLRSTIGMELNELVLLFSHELWRILEPLRGAGKGLLKNLGFS